MRLLYLSIFLLQSFYLIKANEHLPFENVKPTSTITVYQDEQHPTNIYTSNDKKRDRKEVSTKVDVIYTTIIVATTTTIPDIYNVSDSSNPAQQQQSDNNNTGSTNINDPNKKNSVVDDLEKDKQALKRMSTILSLVGGLGVIAIVATIVIFTRMRSRHRKQRELDEEGNEGSTYELSNDVDRPNTIHSSDTSHHHSDHGPSSLTGTEEEREEENSVSSGSITNSNDIDQPLIEPSAPPALSIIDDGNRHSIINKEALIHNRRNVISMSSQRSAPSPSAPTAKELDAMVDEQGSSSSSDNDSHHHHPTSSTTQPSNCSRCAPSILIAPELPPPAYTPSAPPHYALPQEPIVIESLLQSRRHSSGG